MGYTLHSLGNTKDGFLLRQGYKTKTKDFSCQGEKDSFSYFEGSPEGVSKK